MSGESKWSLKTTGRFSIAHVRNAWYVACASDALRTKPLAAKVLDTPVVLFRGEDGQPRALVDRCAHRNVPLSLGRVCEGRIECAYHGWQYDGAGHCRHVPALSGSQDAKVWQVPALAAKEQQGWVWVFGQPGATPDQDPYRIPHLDDRAYVAMRYRAEFEATLHATLENILDVPHTSFLHRGLFRGGRRNRVEVQVRRREHCVEAEFLGEPRPGGVLGRLLAPEGGTVQHIDRFLMPSIAQVEYRLGRNHLTVTSLLTPAESFRTVMHAVVTARLPRAARALKHVIAPLAMYVVRQDAYMLKQQTGSVQAFGGEQFISTPVDVLGPHIWRLLRHAERGEAAPREVEERVEMLT